MTAMNLPAGSLDGYRAVLNSVGLADCSTRGKVRVTGPDRVSFLHAMISNDVQQLAEGAGRYATLLTAQGRIVADFYCYKFPDCMMIDLQGELAGKLVSTLEKFIIMDDVALEDETGRWGHLALQGPETDALLARALAVEAPADELGLRPFQFEGREGFLIRKGYLHTSGAELLMPAPSTVRLKSLLMNHGAIEVDEMAAGLLLLERGIPVYGRDMDESHYPMEARLHHAISLTKGCYIGQEVVAKATHVGGVNRLLCRLRLIGDRVPPAGSVLTAAGKKVGTITSAARSPRFGAPIALGYVRRAQSSPGTRLQAELPGDAAIAAEVVEDFQTG